MIEFEPLRLTTACIESLQHSACAEGERMSPHEIGLAIGNRLPLGLGSGLPDAINGIASQFGDPTIADSIREGYENRIGAIRDGLVATVMQALRAATDASIEPEQRGVAKS